MIDDEMLLRTLTVASKDIETRLKVTSVVDAIVSDIEVWDREVALHMARESLLKERWSHNNCRKAVSRLQEENETLRSRYAEIQIRAGSLRKTFVDEMSRVLVGTREGTLMRKQVESYKDRCHELSRELALYKSKVTLKEDDECESDSVESDINIKSEGTVTKDIGGVISASNYNGETLTYNHGNTSTSTSTPNTPKRRRSSSKSTTPQREYVVNSTIEEVVPVLNLLSLEDSDILLIFSFLSANEVLAVTHLCRGTFKRVDKIFGIGSEVIQPDWPDRLTTVQEMEARRKSIKSIAATPSSSGAWRGLTVPMADAMTEKLSEPEMAVIISMMGELKRQSSEIDTLKSREADLEKHLRSTEEVKDFLVTKLHDAEVALKSSMGEYAALNKQTQSDKEVMRYMDIRTLELEDMNHDLTHRCDRLEAALDLQRGTHDSLQNHLKAEVENERAKLYDLESTFKAQKKVLVKEVKSLRTTLSTTTRELHQYKSQVYTIMSALER